MSARTDTATLVAFLHELARSAELGDHRAAESATRLAELQAEVERLNEHVRRLTEPNLTGVHFAGGAMHIGLEGGACQVFANAFIHQFRESGAENYVECSLQDAETGEKFIVNLQRCAGKSPHRLRQEAEAEVARLADDAMHLDAEREYWMREAKAARARISGAPRGCPMDHPTGCDLRWVTSGSVLPLLNSRATVALVELTAAELEGNTK